MRLWIGTCFAVVNTSPESKKLKKMFKVTALEKTGKMAVFSYKKFNKKFQLYKSTCETLTVDCLIIYLS